MTYGIVLVPSTHEAIKAETLAKEAHLRVRIIPTPEKIFASCGFSLRYVLEDEEALAVLLRDKGIQYEKFYHAYRRGLMTEYEQAEEVH